MQTIRQGDLLFVPVEEIPQGGMVTKSKNGIIQAGEATGHHHRVAVVDAANVYTHQLWNGFERFVETLENPVEVVHEEHGTVTLPPRSKFRVNIAREFDYLGSVGRQVVD